MTAWMAALVAVGTATGVTAQDRAALCATAVEQLEENLATYWALVDRRFEVVAQAQALGRTMPEERRQAVLEAAQMMRSAFSEDHNTVDRRFQNNQYALARTFYLLCQDDWPDDASVPPEDSEVYSVE